VGHDLYARVRVMLPAAASQLIAVSTPLGECEFAHCQ
jgi:hypothetical protein